MRTQSHALGQQRGCGPLLPSPWRAKKLPRRGLLRVRAEYSTDSSSATAADDPMRWNIKKFHKASDGANHLGSVLDRVAERPFPGPPPDEGPPLRVLPIGGLGEIGMNCMLVGVKDRYILVDAGLMFPDFQDLGMQKILPDVSFLAQWRDKIEAVVITHGHEDHIGAMPWVIPALDPSVPVYGGGFVLQLVARRLQEFNLYDPARFHVLDMRSPVTMGPFEVTPIRVTHSIPDCCGLIMRSEHGTIVHTGDWKIDEDPVDGEMFDREAFDLLHKEPIALMMSDSTNVLAPGRTTSERSVEEALVRRVMGHEGKGRVICTQFASNLHRMASVKKAADAAGRRIAFIGMSLNTYLEAAHREGRAPIDPKDLIPQEALPDADPNKVLIITTGSQAEPRAQLSLAARQASNNLKIIPNDLVLYSAKVIPGNEVKVAQMMNGLSMLGAQVVQGRSENLHTSGHAYQDELEEVLRYVKPQHFLPVHGEYAFLCEHARLARERAGVRFTEVIRNGQMLGIHERRNRNTLSMGSMAAATVARDRATGQTSLTAGAADAADANRIEVIGEVPLVNFYNDGGRGTGTAQEMALPERATLAFDGVVVAAVDVFRANPGGRAGAGGAPPPGSPLRCRVRITTRGMWLDKGKMLDAMHQAAQEAVSQLTVEASLTAVERAAVDAIRRAARALNNRRPEVIVVAYEHDPRLGHIPEVAARKAAAETGGGREWQGFGGFRPSEAASKGLGPAAALKAGAEIGGLGGIRMRPPPGTRPGSRGGRGGRDGGRGRGGGGGGSGSDSEGGGASSRSSGGGRGGGGSTGPAGGAAGRGAAAAMAARLAAQATAAGSPKWGWGELQPSTPSSQGTIGSAVSEGTAAASSSDLGRTESAASASSTGSSAAAAEAAPAAPARRRRRSTGPPADAAAAGETAPAEAAPKKRGRKPRAAATGAPAELPPLKVMTPEDMAAMETVAKNPRRTPKEGAAGDDLSYG